MFVEACAQGLVEVGVVGDEALQGLIKANEGRCDERDGHSISLQDLVNKSQKSKLFHIIFNQQHHNTTLLYFQYNIFNNIFNDNKN